MNETPPANRGSDLTDDYSVDLDIDASGLNCPMPLLKVRQGLNQLESGQTIRLRATDAGSVRDVRSYAELSGNKLLHFREQGHHYIYILQKA